MRISAESRRQPPSLLENLLLRMQPEEFMACMAIIFLRQAKEYRDEFDYSMYATPGTEGGLGPNGELPFTEVLVRVIRFMMREGDYQFHNLADMQDDHGNIGDKGKELNDNMRLYLQALTQMLTQPKYAPPFSLDTHQEALLKMIDDGRCGLNRGAVADCLDNMRRHIKETNKVIPDKMAEDQYESRAAVLNTLGIKVRPGKSGIRNEILMRGIKSL